jgi:8-oxo-dGTP diphosphatase
MYRGTLATKRPYKEGVAVLALDRWGRVLLQLRDADLPPERHPDVWSLPGGIIEPDEAPDAAGLREFEEETGHLLEDLKLYRVFRRHDIETLLVDVQHVYFGDPDIVEEAIDVREGQAFQYWGPAETLTLPMPPHARTILGWFFESPAYKALFH